MPEVSSAAAKPVKAKPANQWQIISGVLAVALIAVLVWVFLGNTGEVRPSQQVGTDLVGFINEVYGAQVGTASLKGVETESGLYKVSVTLTAADGTTTDQTVFATRDGKFFIPEPINVADLRSQFQAFQQQQQVPAPTDGTAVDDGQPVVDDEVPAESE